jgi:hypothetical protein
LFYLQRKRKCISYENKRINSSIRKAGSTIARSPLNPSLIRGIYPCIRIG